MAWYMSTAVPETFTSALLAAYRSTYPYADATDQNVLEFLGRVGVRTPEEAAALGRTQFNGTFDAQMIASAPQSDPASDVTRAATQSLGNLFGGGYGAGVLAPLPDPWGLGTSPVNGRTISSNLVTGGTPFPTLGTGGISTGTGWLDDIINFGVGTFLQPRLPMPGQQTGGTQPRLPGGGLPVPTRPGTIPITINGRTRTISARQATAIAAAAAALGITVAEYVERFGLPAARRRMNVLNPKALSRALRRADGFACFARRIIDVTDRKRSGFKQRRKACGRKKGC